MQSDKRSVEAGTTFGATLQDPIGTQTSREGDRFALRLDEDVRAADGTVVIRSGARLDGRIVRVEADEHGSTQREASPRLWLKIESIDGRAVSATVVDAAGFATVGSAKEGEEHDALLMPPIGPKAIGGGPPSEGLTDDGSATQHHLRLPEGTKLQIMLRAPIR